MTERQWRRRMRYLKNILVKMFLLKYRILHIGISGRQDVEIGRQNGEYNQQSTSCFWYDKYFVQTPMKTNINF